MATAISSISSGSGEKYMRTAVVSTNGNRFWLDNYIQDTSDFFLFFTHSSSGNVNGTFTKCIWCPSWDESIYTMLSSSVIDKAYNTQGIKRLQTSNIDSASTNTSIALENNIAITWDGSSFYCPTGVFGASAILVYVG
jgi:hypothetical protein